MGLEGRQSSFQMVNRIKPFQPLFQLPACLVGNCLFTPIQFSEAIGHLLLWELWVYRSLFYPQLLHYTEPSGKEQRPEFKF